MEDPMGVFVAVCFDLDGTLIDTESIYLEAESQCLATFRIDSEDYRRLRTFGLGFELGMQLLADMFYRRGMHSAVLFLFIHRQL
ncbi:MAG: beta-phosphoglucomutase-like phosphatase (HAD superfamily) [Candidatus Latescibacterota bacterium]|jgi:beta-phosphoglucomutase-like phosphatase (HAD superfamily)